MTPEDFERSIMNDPDALAVHLTAVEHQVEVEDCGVSLHCHCMAVDANGRVKPKRLAEFMRGAILDYAIPRSRAQEARERDIRHRSSRAVTELYEEARGLFTDLASSGEGGELLLYILAEQYLGIPQIFSKMSLKTDRRHHYNGADGVHATMLNDGMLKLFWGESKVYRDATSAIRDCLSSMSPFLLQEDSERSAREEDLLLLRDHLDFGDASLTEALKQWFDRSSPLSNRVRYCGIALVGFDVDFYPDEGVPRAAQNVLEAAKLGLDGWAKSVGRRLVAERLESFEIEFLLVPLPSADGFRAAFREALRIQE